MTIKKIKAENVEHDIAAKYDGNEQEISNTYMTKVDPVGSGSLSLNRKADTTVGNYSVAEGYNGTASGKYSHVEGYYTTASTDSAHAEGAITRASGERAHAEGYGAAASGTNSHAEGYSTIASSDNSHAEGDSTIASSVSQHVQGKYNIEDASNTYAHIVGNGSSEDARSNAHTLDWDGNAWFAGNVFIGGTSQEDADQLVDTVSNQNISGVKTFLNGISIGDEGVLIDYNASEKALQITFLQEIGEEEVEGEEVEPTAE